MVAIISIVGCGSSTKTASSTVAPAPATSSSAAPAGSPTINIQDFAFIPGSLTVAPDAVVTVHNSDRQTHTVTAVGASRGDFDTGDIAPNATTTFRAPSKAGSYSYDCRIHVFMTGTLTVS